MNNSSVDESDETGPSPKKPKLTMTEMSSDNIELELLQVANQRWKEYAKKLEAEKLQPANGFNGQRILELESTVTQLQTINGELYAKNEQERNQHKTEMDSTINEYAAKIKLFEDERQGFEAKIKTLNEQIATMKTIKTEIKDTVESERENVQADRNKLKAEINELKKQNAALEKRRQEAEKLLLNSEKRNKESEKKYGETVAANHLLEQKYKFLEATIEKTRHQYQTSISTLKTDNQNLSKTIIDLTNKERELQNSVDGFKKRFETLEKNEPEMKTLSLDNVFTGAKANLSLLSCKTDIIVNISKIEASSEGWKLHSTESTRLRFLTKNEMKKTCFKMNIKGEILIPDFFAPKLQNIMHRIGTCVLTKLHLGCQDINFEDYVKLTSSKTIESCVFEAATVKFDRNKECGVDDLLKHLPNIKEFQYECNSSKKDHSTIAKNLGQLDAFPNLQKFEISNLNQSFKLKDLDTFIKKNKNGVAYVFTFTSKAAKSAWKEIQEDEKKLLKSLSVSYKIRVTNSAKN